MKLIYLINPGVNMKLIYLRPNTSVAGISRPKTSGKHPRMPENRYSEMHSHAFPKKSALVQYKPPTTLQLCAQQFPE
jgi:hypothetical protein